MKNIFTFLIALILTSCASKRQTIITQKNNDQIIFNTKHHSNSKVLYIVNGKKISNKSLKKINPKNIESLQVIKNKKELLKYTKKEFDGAIIITLKKN